MSPRSRNNHRIVAQERPSAAPGVQTSAEMEARNALGAPQPNLAPTRRRLLRSLGAGVIGLATLTTLAACGEEEDD